MKELVEFESKKQHIFFQIARKYKTLCYDWPVRYYIWRFRFIQFN